MLRQFWVRLLALALVVAGPVLLVPGPARATGPDPDDPTTWATFAPGHATPAAGPAFNNPYGSTVQRRRLLTQVIRTIDATPGYRLPRDSSGRLLRTSAGSPVACPEDPALAPAEIKISLYSIADNAFAHALIAAHRRCVSVQVLMNSHLTPALSPSWGRLREALGPRGADWQHQRSFAHRCSNGCLGTSVLHSKFYLFSTAGQATDTVMVGSSNMTTNAVDVQWNDLFTVNGNPTLYGQYRSMFERMVPDVPGDGPWVFRAGPYTSTFYPFRTATERTDRTMRDLRSIRCSGAKGGAGIAGHSVLYIAMHSWHGTRGLYLARQVRRMYDAGCYVRILYSFMGKGTYHLLTHGTGPRMVARRVLFPGPRGLVAVKYSHLKVFAASGNVAGDPSAWVTWTGSNNWTDKSLHADEVTLRIPSRAVYRAYVDHWDFMRRRRSVDWWAIYQEPSGGGRAPEAD
ncbi:MAG: phospholipase D-like domain-containing protein [Nocardioidaceae bacterium]